TRTVLDDVHLFRGGGRVASVAEADELAGHARYLDLHLRDERGRTGEPVFDWQVGGGVVRPRADRRIDLVRHRLLAHLVVELEPERRPDGDELLARVVVDVLNPVDHANLLYILGQARLEVVEDG